MIIKRRKVEYWTDAPQDGLDANPFRHQPVFPWVHVDAVLTDADSGRDFVLLTVEANDLDLPERLIATPTDGSRWHAPRGTDFVSVEGWDVTHDEAYATGLETEPLPPPGAPRGYMVESTSGAGASVFATVAMAGWALRASGRLAGRLLGRRT